MKLEPNPRPRGMVDVGTWLRRFADWCDDRSLRRVHYRSWIPNSRVVVVLMWTGRKRKHTPDD